MNCSNAYHFSCIFILLCIIVSTSSSQDCTNKPPPEEMPCETQPICDILTLDTYCLDMKKGSMQYPFPNNPSVGCYVHNPIWFSFISGTSHISLGFDIMYCDLNLGVQIMIYEGQPDCSSLPPTGLTKIPHLQCNMQYQPGYHTIDFEARPCHIYYVLIDGWSEDLCDVHFDVLVGSDPPPPSDPGGFKDLKLPEFAGPDTICVNANDINLCFLNEPDCVYKYVIEIVGDTTFETSENLDCVIIPDGFQDAGVYEICVYSDILCAESPRRCKEFVVAEPKLEYIYDSICRSEEYYLFGMQLDTEDMPSGDYEYSAIDTETGTEGCSRDIILRLHIRNPDTIVNEAAFIYSESDFLVTFTDRSMGSINSYLWSFGDGNTATNPNPSHRFLPGQYQVTLITQVLCTYDTMTQLVFIKSLKPEIKSSSRKGCVPHIVEYSDTTQGEIVGRSWEFPGGFPNNSIVQNPAIRYDSGGVYDVSLTVWNDSDTSELILEDYITIYDVIEVNFKAEIDGGTVDFINLSEGVIDTFLWVLGDGTISYLKSPVHHYSPGKYNVTLYGINQCYRDTHSYDIFIDSLSAQYSIKNRISCQPAVIEFQDNSKGEVTHRLWSFEGGNPASSTQENPVISYDSLGVYELMLTVYNTEDTSTATWNVNIDTVGIINAEFDFQVDSSEVVFNNLSTGPIDSVYWDFGDGESTTEFNPSHSFMPGVYTVTLYVNNRCFSDTFHRELKLDTLQAGFIINNPMGCIPWSVEYVDTSVGYVHRREWIFENGTPRTSTLRNPVVKYDTSGVYDVQLTVYNSLMNSQLLLEEVVIVNTVPDSDFEVQIMDHTVNFINTTTGATSYQWFFGNSEESNEESPKVIYPNEDKTYEVMLISTNQCGSDTIIKSIEIKKTVSSQEVYDHLSIFPNPFTNEVVIEFSTDLKLNELQFFSVDGRRIDIPSSFLLSEQRLILNTSTLRHGAYFIKIACGGKLFYKKLIKI